MRVRRNVPLIAITAVAGAILLITGSVGATSQAAAAPPPHQKCSYARDGVDLVGGLRSLGTHLVNRSLFPAPVTVHDTFAGLDSAAWRWVNFPDSCITVDHGLTLTIPRGTSAAAYAGSELQSTAAYPAWIGPGQPETSFTARLTGADISGVQGSRGFGYFHTAVLAADTDGAMFIYLNGPAGASSWPNGFYAMTSASGAPTRVTRLDESLLTADHEYTITWARDRVQYLVDGVVVATETTVVPRNRLTASIWADNGSYTVLPSVHLPLLLATGSVPSPKENTVKVTSVELR